MNRFSDRGSTPLVSIPEGRAAKLGLLEVKKYGNPTTVEFVRCMGCSIPEGRAAKLGLSEVEKCSIPTTMEFVHSMGCSIKTLCRNARRFLYFVPVFASAETDSFICICGIFPTESSEKIFSYIKTLSLRLLCSVI